MPLKNGLPLATGASWASTTPVGATELITQWDLSEASALSTDPGPDLAWAKVGTRTTVGVGIVKVFHAAPKGSMDYRPFEGGNKRVYHTDDVVATTIKVSPRDLNFAYPMVFERIGNGYKLMSSVNDGSLIDFIGFGAKPAQCVISGRHLMAQTVSDLFYSSFYATTGGLTITTPTKLTHPQPKNPNGIALFTDGTGAEGTPGAQHYINPVWDQSGRIKNVYFAYGAFELMFQDSLVQMSVKPHLALSNVTTGARVTDVIGGTKMRKKFFNMMVSDLVPYIATGAAGTDVAAGVTNPMAAAKMLGITEENFEGSPFGPRRFWCAPQLDNHPYLVQNPTADFWINISAGKGRPAWAQLASNSAEWVPTFHFYGPGDPTAQRDLMCRFETDLDGGGMPGAYAEIDMFGSV